MPFSIADHPQVRQIIDIALAEDLPYGDITTDSVLKGTEFAEAVFRAKADGVLAGLEVARAVLHRVDPGLGFEAAREDGDHVEEGMALAQVAGSAASILKAERLALNFLQHLSGVATETWEMVKLTAHTAARIVDTRKTTPGLRALEKHAVRVGGGANHRFGLSDGVLIKDNHIEAVGTLKEAVARAREAAPHLTKIEVECASLDQVREALDAEADAILLDNMEPIMLSRAVEVVGGAAITEASGNITRATIKRVAETGVDLISSGAITHSAPALDISLKFEDPNPPTERRLQRIR
ncbi:MAG: carboxylating nicotinate-nucleotide diphosphorylase [Armatimonadia bacterium]|nr:carboxylating nicotinate-nucleotide diphosphorylase [Armatimonadia bacterium]